MSEATAAVVGGAVAGLAAAERLRAFADVTLFERQPYDEKRVNCGEAINDADLVPLASTPENGFHNDVDAFEVRVHPDADRGPDERPMATARLPCEPGYVCDRDLVERRWAERLRERGVTVRTGPAANVTPAEFEDLAAEYDYVVDATGQPSLTAKARGRVDRYTGDMVALNADVTGDFAAFESTPRIRFEGYVGYAWAFPKSADRANVGIGWASDERPGDYMAAFRAACDRMGVPRPDRSATNVYTIPRGPSLNPDYAAYPDDGLYLVGDAAGVANRYQGEGIVQGIRSSYLLGDLLAAGEGAAYPRRLYRLMAGEYRLARLMRGAWVEHEDPELLAGLVEALDGLPVEAMTRDPGAVVRRVARRPAVAARLLADRGMIDRLVAAWTDDWEFGRRWPVPSSG